MLAEQRARGGPRKQPALAVFLVVLAVVETVEYLVVVVVETVETVGNCFYGCDGLVLLLWPCSSVSFALTASSSRNSNCAHLLGFVFVRLHLVFPMLQTAHPNDAHPFPELQSRPASMLFMLPLPLPLYCLGT